MTHKNRIKSRIYMFLSTGCSLLRAEGSSCCLGVLYGGLGISKQQFLIKKIEIKFPATKFFQFQVINPWIRIRDSDPDIRNQKKMLDPDPYPDPHQINADPKPCLIHCSFLRIFIESQRDSRPHRKSKKVTGHVVFVIFLLKKEWPGLCGSCMYMLGEVYLHTHPRIAPLQLQSADTHTERGGTDNLGFFIRR